METSADHKWVIKNGRIKGQVSSFGNINDTFTRKVLGGFKLDPNMPKIFSDPTILKIKSDELDEVKVYCAMCMTVSDITNFNWSFDSWMRPDKTKTGRNTLVHSN